MKDTYQMPMIKRIFQDNDPFAGNFNVQEIGGHGNWPASWLRFPQNAPAQSVVYFKLEFSLEEDSKIRIHLSADERYKLFLDGQYVSSGPSKGDQFNWYHKSYDLMLTKGRHVFVAQVWRLGELRPMSQMSVESGFILAAEGSFASRLNTGVARWVVKQAIEYRFRKNDFCFALGHITIIDGDKFSIDRVVEDCDDWEPALSGNVGRSGLHHSNFEVSGHHLIPDTLPDMIYSKIAAGKVIYADSPSELETWKYPVLSKNNDDDSVIKWQDLISENRSLYIEPDKAIRVIIDLEDYYCAYPYVKLDGGKDALVRISWSEALYEQSIYDCINNNKGNRNEVSGKYFIAQGDEFYPRGEDDMEFEPLWWHSGRYIEIFIKTNDYHLVLKKFSLNETRYPLEQKSEFECDDERLMGIIPLTVRSLQMCSHETFMDCPYYEQLMYAGDTRLELLIWYCLTDDVRLPRKAITLLSSCDKSSGFTWARYPSTLQQIIPTFSIWWIGMVYDYALWRGDKDFISSFRPQIQSVLGAFERYMDKAQNLLITPNGWNFVDWVSEWAHGVPPQAMPGQVSSILNLQLVLGLEYASQIERWVGDLNLAEYYSKRASILLNSIVEKFWCSKKSLLADDLGKISFSEHAQILAILCRSCPKELAEKLGNSLFHSKELSGTTVYFNHYYFEACYKLKNTKAFFNRLKIWTVMKQNGLKTTSEEQTCPRSDCHAWSSHPLYHMFASLLGIRPEGLGFEKYQINPMPEKNINCTGLLPVFPGKTISAVLNSDAELKYMAGNNRNEENECMIPAKVEALELAET